MDIDITIRNRQGEILNCADHKISQEILEKSDGQLKISAMIPIVEITGIWYPAHSAITRMKLFWNVEFVSGASYSMPVLLFLDQNSKANYAIGLTNGIDDCRITSKMNQELCVFEVSFTIAISPETEPFEVFFDDSRREASEVLQSYRDMVLPVIPEYPAGAWEAVYCSWYAVHAAITDEYLQENAVEARRLGFGTFIVDDGWCFSENKRVTPQTLPDWYRDIGDWQWSEEKLPEMKNTVRKAQELGLNYMFWVAPFFSGRRSELDKSVSKYLTELHEGQRVFDPEDAAAAGKTLASICDIFRQMALDGLKIDFVDAVIPDPDHPHCRAVKKYMEKLIGRVRELKPSALIEFRQGYATLVNASLATAFRAGDVPFDYMDNFSRCVQLRMILGDCIPVHADPVYFNPDEPVTAVGRHMIASLAGVPMLSMELRNISKEHKEVVKNYIGFYTAHRKTLNFGHWSMDLRNGFPAAVKCCDGDGCVVIISDTGALEDALSDCCGKVAVLNMSAREFTASGSIFDAAGNPCAGNKVPSGGRVEFLL